MTQSIVDYLKSQGKPSSFWYRAKLAGQYGISDYRGTADQNIKLLNILKQQEKRTPTREQQLSTLKQKLLEIQKGLARVSDLTKTVKSPDFNLPPIGTHHIESAITNAKTVNSLHQEWAKNLKEERSALEKSLESEGVEGATLWQKAINLLKKKPEVDIEAKLESLQNKYHLSDLLEKANNQNLKIVNLEKEINQLDVERQKEVERAYSQGMPISYIKREVNEINRQYNIKKAYKVAELSSEAAVLRAYQGNLNQARSLISDAINAYTHDIQQKRADFDNLFNLYGDWINTLNNEDRRLLEQRRQELKEEEERVRGEKLKVLELKLKYPEAGISISDPLNTAIEKAGEWRRLESKQPKASDYQIITDEEGNMWRVNKLTGEKSALGIKKSGGESVALPTIYGLTKKQTKDVLFSETPPNWFVSELEQASQTSFTPEYLGELWQQYKDDVIKRSKEIKRELGNDMFSLWNNI